MPLVPKCTGLHITSHDEVGELMRYYLNTMMSASLLEKEQVRMYSHRREQQKIKVVVLRLPFIHPDEYVDGKSLESSKQFRSVPLHSLQAGQSISSVSECFETDFNMGKPTSARKRSHSSRTFIQKSFRLPCPFQLIMPTRLMQLSNDSMLLFSISADTDRGWMKGGRVLWRTIIRGYDFSTCNMRLVILCAPACGRGRRMSDLTVSVGLVGIDI